MGHILNLTFQKIANTHTELSYAPKEREQKC